MAQRLSELCRNRLSQTRENVSMPANFPLPSTAENILASSPKTLPFGMANQLVEDLAKRGKLTSTVLQLLMQSTLTRLNLMCLRSIDDEPKFLSQLANQRHVVDIDVSFSPCLGQLSVPFVRALSSSCKETLVSFSASYVRGNLGIEDLRDFTRLRHLDVSFTRVSMKTIRDLCGCLKDLTHLDVSGTDMTWPEVFDVASKLTQLKHLGMNHLKIMTYNEERAFCEPDLRTDWLTSFFDNVKALTSLDVSFGNRTYFESDVLTLIMDTVLMNAPKSLTRLVTSWWVSDQVSRVYDADNFPFELVIFLANRRTPIHRLVHWEESILVRGLILHSDLDWKRLPVNAAQIILSKGLSLLNRNDFVSAIKATCFSLEKALSSGKNCSIYFQELLQVTVYVVQRHIVLDDVAESFFLRLQQIFSLKAQLKEREYWHEIQHSWDAFVESLLQPSFYRCDGDGVISLYVCSRLESLASNVLEELRVRSKPSLVATVFVLRMVDRFRQNSPAYHHRMNVVIDGVVMKILEPFFESLSNKEKREFVIMNDFPKMIKNRLYKFIALSRRHDDLGEGRFSWEYFDGSVTFYFDVLNLISSNLPVVQKQLVDNGVVSSDVQAFVIDQLRAEEFEVNMTFVAFLIALAENSLLSKKMIACPLRRVLCRNESPTCLWKSYLLCLLLLNESSSSQQTSRSQCFKTDFASEAVYFPRNLSTSELNYANKVFRFTSLRRMSVFTIPQVADFGRNCLKALQT